MDKMTTIRSQILLAIAISLLILAIGFTFAFVQFENKRRETVKQKIVDLLSALSRMKKNELASEILLNHKDSIKLLMNEITLVEGIVNLSIIKPDGTRFNANETYLDDPSAPDGAIQDLEDYKKREFETNKTPYWYFEKKIQNHLILIYLEPVEAAGEMIALLKIFYSLDYVQKENQLSILYYILYFFAILISMAMLIHVLLSRHIVRPVNQLVDAMSATHDGLLGQKVEILSQNEIGSMAKTFNTMSSENARLYNELKQSHKDLEQRSRELLLLNNELNAEIEVRRKAEEEATFLRNYLKNVFNSMPSVLIGVNPQGRITQMNNEAVKAAQAQTQSSIGRPLLEIFPGLAHQMGKIHQAIAERKIITDREISGQGSDEKSFCDVTIFPLVSNGVDGAVIRIDDVTNRVKIEELMIQTEKMMSIGGLAAGMAHEINNPLSGILQNHQVMTRRLSTDLEANLKVAQTIGLNMDTMLQYFKDREIDRMMDAIQSAARRASEIVKNMLSFARKSSEGKTASSIPELLDQAVNLASSHYDLKKQYDFKKIKIIREYLEDIPEIPCEPVKIQQVFINILKNGAEAMSEKSYEAPDTPCFVLRVYEAQGMVYIEIEDNGTGIDPVSKKRIFEPFYTTKTVGKGTGLGLSVSYFIIKENHHGEIRVESAPGRFTRFIISLPINPEN